MLFSIAIGKHSYPKHITIHSTVGSAKLLVSDRSFEIIVCDYLGVPITAIKSFRVSMVGITDWIVMDLNNSVSSFDSDYISTMDYLTLLDSILAPAAVILSNFS